MNLESHSLKSGSVLPGVFAYLDAVLTPEQIEEATRYDLTHIRGHECCDYWPGQTLRRQVVEVIDSVFRLQFGGCPLNKELGGYGLYCHEDMADALTAAYFLSKRGQDPVEALNADFLLKPFGLLYWKDIEELKGEAVDESLSMWRQFSRFYQKGDRIVEYRCLPSTGLLLVRGERLVWEVETIRWIVTSPSPRWNADYDHFNSLGGNRAFLAGEFTWPPANWVNPVTPEEEAEAAWKRS